MTIREKPEQDGATGRFVKGNCGGGRPKGSRNQLAESFLDALRADFNEHGVKAIEDARAESALGYVKVIASLMPKDVNLNLNDHSEMTDDELAERVRTLAAQLAPFLVAGDGDAQAGTGRENRAQITSRVH